MNARSTAESAGSSSRWRSAREPSRTPDSCSFRYTPAHSTSPGSTGASNENNRFVTDPAEVMSTAINTWGWSSSTSTRRTVAVSIGGAETSASSRVTCESMSVVDWSAASSSLLGSPRSRGKDAGRGSSRSSRRSA